MEVPPKVTQEAELELARSSGWSAALVYPIVMVLGTLALDLWQTDMTLIAVLFPILAACCGVRLTSATRLRKNGYNDNWGRALRSSILATAVCWTAYNLGILLHHGNTWPGQFAFITLICSSAIASLSLMANRNVLTAYLLITNAPAALAVVAIHPPQPYLLGLIVLAATFYLLQQASLNHRRYIGALIDREHLQEAREVERIRRETELKQRDELELRQKELMESRRVAEQASRAKGEFLATMSHEIRTPMNAIFGMSEMLLESRLTDQQKDWAETIRTSCEALLSLINDILDFSKIESGKLEVSAKPVDVRRCVQEALTLVGKAADGRGVVLKSEISPEVPDFIVSDGGRVRQILLNLLSNAVKFTKDGSVSVSVQFQNRQLLFALQDSGIGIPPDRMHRLFQSFSQVDSSTTRMYGGTGLGLAISQRLCEKLGGQIWVESGGSVAGKVPAQFEKRNPPTGSTFYFTIAAEPTQGTISAAPPLTADLAGLKGLPVLVVEDNPVNQKVLLQMLKRFEVDATAVPSGQDALEAIKVRKFTLILMDIQMPGMDGYATTIAIRKKHPADDVWILAITANAFQEDREACLKLGMNDYLSKPVRAAELTLAMQRFISRGS